MYLCNLNVHFCFRDTWQFMVLIPKIRTIMKKCLKIMILTNTQTNKQTHKKIQSKQLIIQILRDLIEMCYDYFSDFFDYQP